MQLQAITKAAATFKGNIRDAPRMHSILRLRLERSLVWAHADAALLSLGRNVPVLLALSQRRKQARSG